MLKRVIERREIITLGNWQKNNRYINAFRDKEEWKELEYHCRNNNNSTLRRFKIM